MSESSRQPARYGERGGVPMPQDGAPPTSVDVLAAQVRRPLDYPIGVTVGELADAKAALDALVARVTDLEAALKDEMKWDMGGVPENEWKRRAVSAEAALADLDGNQP